MRHLLLLLLFVFLTGCLGPLQPPPPRPDDDDVADDDDSSADDDDVVDDDDTSDDDDVVDDDDVEPLGPTSRLCSTAGRSSNGIYTAITCTGPAEMAPGVSTNGTYTVVTGTLHLISE